MGNLGLAGLSEAGEKSKNLQLFHSFLYEKEMFVCDGCRGYNTGSGAGDLVLGAWISHAELENKMSLQLRVCRVEGVNIRRTFNAQYGP